MNKYFSLFGATGSIGDFTLQVIDNINEEKPVIFLLSGNLQTEKLAKLAKKYNPEFLHIPEKKKDELYRLLDDNLKKRINIITSFDEIYEAYRNENACEHYFINGIIGTGGMLPSFLSQHFNIKSAIANKESVILSHELFEDLDTSLIYPLDSEQHGIYKILPFIKKEEIENVYITASGGKVYKKTDDEILSLNLDDVVKHPNWKMGKRITVDSSTGVNKAYEYIETQALFNIPKEKIRIVIDQKSLIHAIIQDKKNNYYFAASNPDMHLPILSFFESIGIYSLIKIAPLSFIDFQVQLTDILSKSYPILGPFINNYDKSLFAGTFLIVLNNRLLDSFFDYKISFSELRDKLCNILNILFQKRDDFYQSLFKNFNKLSFTDKDSYIKINEFLDNMNKIVEKFV